MDVPVEPERPGAPTAAAIAVTPDGATVVGVVGTAGVFVGVAGGGPAWQRVATPSAPTSRDVAIAGDQIVWTAAQGVFSRRLRLAGGVLSLGAERRIAPPDRGQPRYPLVAVSAGTVNVLWTADRTRLVHSVLGGSPPPGVPSGDRHTAGPFGAPSGDRLGVPAAAGSFGAPSGDGLSAPAAAGPFGAPSGGRLTGLSAAPADRGAVWLAARTEDGAVAVTRWDPATGAADGWRPLDPPAPVAVVTIVAGPVVLGFTAGGRLIAVAGAGPWRSVDLPPGVPHPHRAPQAIAAAEDRLLVADGSTTWLATLHRAGGSPTLGDGRILPL